MKKQKVRNKSYLEMYALLWWVRLKTFFLGPKFYVGAIVEHRKPRQSKSGENTVAIFKLTEFLGISLEQTSPLSIEELWWVKRVVNDDKQNSYGIVLPVGLTYVLSSRWDTGYDPYKKGDLNCGINMAPILSVFEPTAGAITPHLKEETPSLAMASER